ncbi:hypothetical protein GR211_16685 [Rhizobium leguminosarum]|uniref:hypothetical protein n=1 Tax=Rhizobium ruizarguesonis TaxID=2081791 RepID=UPI0013BB22C6|nr:hypothetical protein [Rhizobium ruizarguesonis]NEJ14172.1 hypothetical protein [Rhizobium ruizarguesonis]NEK28545.1 hypothetical protein [Rhizobium ruizarguesonis]
MSDDSKSLAELAAMKARGELTAEQFDDARKLLSPDVPPTRLNFGARQTPKKNGDGGKILLVLLIILGGLWSLGFLSDETPEEKERAKSEALLESSKKADDKRKGFHCLSAWDGSDRQLVDAVKESLRDPSSFEHDETRISPVNAEGLHFVIMTFRAKNGFGGTNVGSATGMVRQSDCRLMNWQLVSS